MNAMVELTDAELIERFEASSLTDEQFHHAEHVRAAFLYLGRYPLLEALERFSSLLLRMSTLKGKPHRYHETVTWAYLFIVNERRAGRQETWPEFMARNPDLLDWKNSLLKSYYRDETLASDRARKQFVLPDKFV